MTPRVKPLSPDRIFNGRDDVKNLMTLQRRVGHFGRLPPFDPRALIEAILPYANENPTLVEKARANLYLRPGANLSRTLNVPDTTLQNLYASRQNPFKREMIESPLLKHLNGWWQESADDRQIFHDSLGLIAKDRKAARSEFDEPLKDTVSRICVIPTLAWDGAQTNVHLSYVAVDHEAVREYVLMLLLDESKGLGKLLRKCRYDECQGFFLTRSTTGGGPMPIYCRPEHRILATSATDAERAARYRERKAARKPK